MALKESCSSIVAALWRHFWLYSVAPIARHDRTLTWPTCLAKVSASVGAAVSPLSCPQDRFTNHLELQVMSQEVLRAVAVAQPVPAGFPPGDHSRESRAAFA